MACVLLARPRRMPRKRIKSETGAERQQDCREEDQYLAQKHERRLPAWRTSANRRKPATHPPTDAHPRFRGSADGRSYNIDRKRPATITVLHALAVSSTCSFCRRIATTRFALGAATTGAPLAARTVALASRIGPAGIRCLHRLAMAARLEVPRRAQAARNSPTADHGHRYHRPNHRRLKASAECAN